MTEKRITFLSPNSLKVDFFLNAFIAYYLREEGDEDWGLTSIPYKYVKTKLTGAEVSALIISDNPDIIFTEELNFDMIRRIWINQYNEHITKLARKMAGNSL